MNFTWPSIRLSLSAVAGAVYLGLSYLAGASKLPALLAIILGILPFGAFAVISAWHSRLRALLLSLYAVLGLTFVMSVHNLRLPAAWLFFVQHAGTMSLLCFTFGITLVGTHADALCSRVAGFIQREPMDASYLHYTWKVTLAWTMFFAITALVSVLLFFFGPIEIWSFFANLLTPILLGCMFAGEYLIRVRTMPDRPHFSVTETIAAFRAYSRRQNPD